MKNSINIVHEENCCGCEACVQRCPKHCIKMREDCKGFLYPVVDHHECINCGLCVDTCPTINHGTKKLPKNVYAAYNEDSSKLMNSSSGGIFTAIAEKFIDNGGVVFGAKFDRNWNVIHAYTETVEGLAGFRGSKYVQSHIGETFIQAEQFLKAGRQVLFSGTPCQISGLKCFLRKNYENLFTIDLICHGVPSPLVWKNYVEQELQSTDVIDRNDVDSSAKNGELSFLTNISFRDKQNGWEKSGFSASFAFSKNCENYDFKHVKRIYEPLNENIYLKGFLMNLYLRPSCAYCPSKSGKSGSDVTLADFWGISSCYPSLYNKDGVSLVIAASKRGDEIIQSLQHVKRVQVDYSKAIEFNTPYEHSVSIPPVSAVFWKYFSTDGIYAVRKTIKASNPSLLKRIVCRLRLHIRF